MNELGVEHSDWKSIKPVDGVDRIDPSKGKLQEVAGQSYRGMAQFLHSQKFDPAKLAMRVELVDDKPRW